MDLASTNVATVTQEKSEIKREGGKKKKRSREKQKGHILQREGLGACGHGSPFFREGPLFMFQGEGRGLQASDF